MTQKENLFRQLNLPPAQLQLRRVADGTAEVFDPLRGKWVALTPEEWVRQHFTGWLRSAKGYPASMMANEVGLRLNGTLRRADTVVYSGALEPIAIVEYKSPAVAITRGVFDQIARYNITLGARVLIVSNGMSHYCCRFAGGRYTFLEDIPLYKDI